MLQSVHVKNLALIDEIEVDFSNGLNILTGETGAGKSIILGSVNLALGGKFNKEIIRKGSDYGLVEICFYVDQPEIIEQLKLLEIYPEDGVVVLSRRMTEGRSVSRINGETVNMSRLKAASSLLIDIHGQHEHQSLLYKNNHLNILDDFAFKYIAEIKQHVSASFQEYKKIKQELEEANLNEADREKELAFLQFELEDIEKANLVPGEDDELELQFQRMNHGKKIVESISEAVGYTSENNENASDQLSRAVRTLSEISGFDKTAASLYEQAVEIDSLLNDLNRDLSDYKNTCEFSEEDFYETENRLNLINRMKMRYGNSIEDILQYAAEKKKEIEKLNDYDNYVANLRISLAKSEEKLKKYSTLLSEKRKEQALILEKSIEEGLRDLNFADVKFKIDFGTLEHYSSLGIDDVEFMISLNPGQPVKPLVRVASGGELSRIMLAIKTVMADRDQIMTLIFDEIDVGISGRTAQKVSEKMAVIGKNHQVICITHLPQIAAMADHNFLIEKKIDQNDTTTSIRRISKEEKIDEVARMLGGVKITEAVRKNAVEMIGLAEQIKRS